MSLGWIDFSKTERSKVLTVLDMLTQDGTLDELGIAPVRDGFSNLFFPGTSTIQTRAKYFFVVPYALKDLEYSSETVPGKMLVSLDAMERRCGEKFLSLNVGEEGVIGKRSLVSGGWVKRTPADIYWAGLRRYGIFIGGSLSLSEYIRALCTQKNQKSALKSLGNRRDDAEENEADDLDAGSGGRIQFWHMPLYRKDWFDTLSIGLTEAEGRFLKEQIIMSCPDSMLGFILEHEMHEILDIDSYQHLEGIIGKFPEQMQEDYQLALAFSDFIFVVRAVYNDILSEGENVEARDLLEMKKPRFAEIADIDMDYVLRRLQIFHNPMLLRFLQSAKAAMQDGDMEGLKKIIRDREVFLKGQSRAKTAHPGEFDRQKWMGGKELDYRFRTAQTIIRDIFESEGRAHAESE